MAALIAGCGGGGSGPSNSELVVTGNAPAVAGREQIVAANNNGRFQVNVHVPLQRSDKATVFFTNNPDGGSQEQIIDLRCLEYHACVFDITVGCVLTADNKVSCNGDDGNGRVQVDFPVADMNPLLTGASTDLDVVLNVEVAGAQVEQQIVPVTVTVQPPQP